MRTHQPALERLIAARASKDLEQHQNQNNGENQAESASTVVAPAGTNAIAALADSKDEQQQNDDRQHVFLLAHNRDCSSRIRRFAIVNSGDERSARI